MSILAPPSDGFPLSVPAVVIGAGACGQVAALTLRDAGVEVVLLERDALAQGSTALSSGMIPACGTAAQAALGVDDPAELMAEDIQAKCHGEADPAIVAAVCAESGPAVDWLTERHGVPLSVVEGFHYPGHRRLRMHAPPSRTGAELMAALTAATAAAGAELLTGAQVTDLFADDDGRIHGVGYRRPDGQRETIGCGALVLACNGFGGNAEMVRRHIPEMASADYFGHPGNQGDAVRWGQALGADVRHMSAYQGHGSVASPHGILITWALIMQGGIQVNRLGRRFSDEQQGYSEQAVNVLAQPDGLAWTIFDDRLLALGREFEDFRRAEGAGALRSGRDAATLAAATGVPAGALAATLRDAAALAGGEGRDVFGREFTAAPALVPPYHAIRVTGALFHTQGGLRIDARARVLRADGRPLPNLYAGGGAAAGVSGDTVSGYLSGNGLLTAVTLGRIAGRSVAAQVGGKGADRRRLIRPGE